MWDALTAIATTSLVVVGGWQILSIRSMNKKLRTLDVTQQYTLDPLLHASIMKIREAQRAGTFAGHEAVYRGEIVTILNYLDCLAIGIEQGLYVEAIAHDHLRQAVISHFDEFLVGDAPRKIGVTVDEFEKLMSLRNAWSRKELRHREKGLF